MPKIKTNKATEYQQRTKQYGMASANSIKYCNCDAVTDFLTCFVLGKLKKYLNFSEGTRSRITVSNHKTNLTITIKLFWSVNEANNRN